jgi:hypothetical protein
MMGTLMIGGWRMRRGTGVGVGRMMIGGWMMMRMGVGVGRMMIGGGRMMIGMGVGVGTSAAALFSGYSGVLAANNTTAPNLATTGSPTARMNLA